MYTLVPLASNPHPPEGAATETPGTTANQDPTTKVAVANSPRLTFIAPPALLALLGEDLRMVGRLPRACACRTPATAHREQRVPNATDHDDHHYHEDHRRGRP